LASGDTDSTDHWRADYTDDQKSDETFHGDFESRCKTALLLRLGTKVALFHEKKTKVENLVTGFL
jgi:hypothetical protein